MKDADPLEGESTKRSLMGAAAFAVALVKGFGPEGARDGLPHPLDEGLALEGGACEAPVHPALVATALSDGGDADVLLQGGSVWESLASFAEGDQQARSEGGTAPGRESKGSSSGSLGEKRGDLCVEALDGGVHGTELRGVERLVGVRASDSR